MMNLNNRIILIIPCYNEAARLNFNEFDKYRDIIDFVFGDDGSQDLTSDLIKKHSYPVISHSKNMGKSVIIQTVYQHLINTNRAINYHWIGFWDADLSIPLSSIIKSFETIHENNLAPDAITFSRSKKNIFKNKQTLSRLFLSYAFSFLVKYFFKINAIDPQCGAKIFTLKAAKNAFDGPFISKWVFDLEIFFRLHNHNIFNFPLAEWEQKNGSKISLIKDIIPITIDIFKIKKQYS